MRLAWCQPIARGQTPTSLPEPLVPSGPVEIRRAEALDDTAALIAELRSQHDLTTFDHQSIHDLVRLDFRQPFDLCVYELADSDAHAFLWPYVMHYPGLVRLRGASLHRSRASALARQRRGRDRDVELAFGRGDLTAAALFASRIVVVSDAHHADALRRDYPDARIRVAPIGVADAQRHILDTRQRQTTSGPLQRIGILAHSIRHTIVDAVERARAAGAPVELLDAVSPDRVLSEADIVLLLPWPPNDDVTAAIAALASGRPLVIFETHASAGWPSLDPQTWRTRGIDVADAPIAIAIDPRDEVHSLALAIRRLSTDAALRDELGRQAREWWRRHGTVAHAAAAWSAILEEAAALTAPPRPPDWPQHLTADGTARARELLGPFGVSVDFLQDSSPLAHG
jgi:hypothetical protein